MATSADTGAVPHSIPRILGVDDWAWRRGRRYGTVLVDLEGKKIVDLLPDRDGGSLATWLQAHPGTKSSPVIAAALMRAAPEKVRQMLARSRIAGICCATAPISCLAQWSGNIA